MLKTMKRTIHLRTLILGLLMVLGMASVGMAQSPEGTIRAVTSAIKAGAAEALSAHFGSNVEITVPGSENTYSSQQALFVMKKYFEDYPVRDFQIIHQGSSGSTYYATGSTTGDRGNFDTNIFVKKAGEKYTIIQIRFESE